MSPVHMLVRAWRENRIQKEMKGEEPPGAPTVIVDSPEAHLRPVPQGRLIRTLMEAAGRWSQPTRRRTSPPGGGGEGAGASRRHGTEEGHTQMLRKEYPGGDSRLVLETGEHVCPGDGSLQALRPGMLDRGGGGDAPGRG